MKNQVCKWMLVGAAAMVLNAGVAFAADSMATNAAPGTPASTDTKSQENSPPGPTNQATASTPSGTKKHHHRPKSTDPVPNQAGDTTSKTPQAGSSPSTNSGMASPTTNTP
jgi:hypothetical protein